MAVFAPIPSASATIATAVNPGLRRNVRIEYRISFSMNTPPAPTSEPRLEEAVLPEACDQCVKGTGNVAMNGVLNPKPGGLYCRNQTQVWRVGKRQHSE